MKGVFKNIIEYADGTEVPITHANRREAVKAAIEIFDANPTVVYVETVYFLNGKRNQIVGTCERRHT